jgi:hypothetical protein
VGTGKEGGVERRVRWGLGKEGEGVRVGMGLGVDLQLERRLLRGRKGYAENLVLSLSHSCLIPLCQLGLGLRLGLGFCPIMLGRLGSEN